VASAIVLLSIKPRSSSLYPEELEIEAIAWWQPDADEPELHVEITLVKLDVNDFYYLRDALLNPHNGEKEAYADLGLGVRVAEGDVVRFTFGEFSNDFQLRKGDRVDIVLPFYDMERVVMDTRQGRAVRERLKCIGEIGFSVEVQGELPLEFRQ
jgi:hypothetical protein